MSGKEKVSPTSRGTDKEEEAAEEKWVLSAVQPILAEDWNSPGDDYWNDY